MGEMNFEQKGIVKAVDTALQEVEQSAVECAWQRLAAGFMSAGTKAAAPRLWAAGVLCRVPRSLRTVRPLEGKLSDGLQQPQRADGGQRSGHLAALDTGWPAALCARDRAAWRRRRARDSRHDQDHQRRKPAPRTGASGAEQAKRCSDEERAARAAQLAKSTAWMDAALAESTGEALRTPWILDADTTVKLLYGHQAGAEIGYNPTKPGRPSHTLHTYWIGNVRLVLDVEVQGGKSTAAKHSLPRLRLLLDRLAPEERPALVRGDNAFGNEGVMAEMEEIDQPYLFKLRQTAGVKRLIERLWQRGDWQSVDQGFDAVEGKLRLTGWSRERRVVVLRRRVKSSLAPKRATRVRSKSCRS
jgi:hypothetical protein